MQRFGRPSPATVISILALLVALGGTAYAASKINGSQVERGSLPGNRVETNSLTGKQIKESSLGPVPKVKGFFNTGLVNASVGQTKPLLKLGPFRVFGVCDSGSAVVILRTTKSGSSADSYVNEADLGNFNPGTDIQLGYGADDATNQVAIYYDYYDSWTAIAPGGTAIFRGQAGSAVGLLNAPCSFIVNGQKIR